MSLNLVDVGDFVETTEAGQRSNSYQGEVTRVSAVGFALRVTARRNLTWGLEGWRDIEPEVMVWAWKAVRNVRVLERAA